MNYKLAELLDVPKLQALMDSLDELYSIPSAIIDMEGNILTGTSWQDICTKFHRANPESEKECIKSDTHIVGELSKGKKQVVYKCPQGLVDTATPIMVDGKHIGNAFTGQFFLESPDEEQFRKLAKKYGFDEEAYIEAMRRVPIITEDKHKKNLKVLANLTEVLAEQGLKQKRQLEVEEALIISEKRFRQLVENAPVPLSIVNINGEIEYFNEKHLDLYGYSHEEFKDVKAFQLLVYPEKEYREDIASEWSNFIDNIDNLGDKIKVFVRKVKCKDGTNKFIEMKLSLMEGKLIVVQNDITDNKFAEEKISQSLAEKEVLLKEVHHRVKNNMAVISSLLSLQSGYIDDEKSLSLFKESQSRIRSMALVHEKLYKSEDFAHIDVRDYIQTLAQSIKNTFAGETDVNSKIDVQDIELDIDVLIPCGLIINEITTNSFKHAFEGQDNPEINISLKETDADNVVLTISDNGKGFPEGFDISKSTGLGLKLVKILVNQITGTMDVQSSNDVTYTITFPKYVEHARHLPDNG